MFKMLSSPSILFQALSDNDKLYSSVLHGQLMGMKIQYLSTYLAHATGIIKINALCE
jgi:hypothetical protein